MYGQLIEHDKPVLNKVGTSIPSELFDNLLQWVSYEVLLHMMPIYQIVRMELSLFSSQYYFTNFTSLIKKIVVGIYYYIKGDHEGSGFRKPVVK